MSTLKCPQTCLHPEISLIDKDKEYTDVKLSLKTLSKAGCLSQPSDPDLTEQLRSA